MGLIGSLKNFLKSEVGTTPGSGDGIVVNVPAGTTRAVDANSQLMINDVLAVEGGYEVSGLLKVYAWPA